MTGASRGFTVATFRDHHLDAALALWAATEHLGPTPPDEVAALRAHDPGLVLVAEDDRQVLGVVLGSFDGRRGWISRLAVTDAARRRGVARALVAEVERRLAARGCRQVNLLTFDDNEGGRALWESLGYRGIDRVVLYSRALDGSGDATDGPDTRGPGC